MKLFGGASGARVSGHRPEVASPVEADPMQASVPEAMPRQKRKKKKNPFKALAIVLAVILVLEGCYFFVVFTQGNFIAKLRNTYISTAMDTMSHQWLATAFFPQEVIQAVLQERVDAQEAQTGIHSNWGKDEDKVKPLIPYDDPKPANPSVDVDNVDMSIVEKEDPEEAAKENFFQIFHEIDPTSFEAYLKLHPEALDQGWANLSINEAGLDDKGTEIKTIHGDQVLAVDYPNQILLIRVKGTGYRGVLALGKDPARLVHVPCSTLGERGQTVADMAAANNGVLAMNGSGFMDDEGGGDGGTITGYAMCQGVEYGYHYVARGEKRLELHEDNLMYIYDTSDPVDPTCTDAVEWHPAMIVDGQDVVGPGWDGLQPRACIGQNDNYEVMMLVVEGRQTQSLGITLYDCVDILLRYGAMQVMNLDGGTSAMLWYKGEPVISCSNSNLPNGRDLPTALVYQAP